MAWNGNNGNWKWQLRDRKGRWIEMGRTAKWYSPTHGRELTGKVVGASGRNAIVELTNEPNDPKTGKLQQVPVKGSDIEIVQSKATLGKPAAKPAAPKAAVPEDNDADNAPAATAPPVAKKYNDAGLTAEEQKAVDFQEKKAKQAADKGDLDAADRYETSAAKTRKIGEDRIKNGEGDDLADDDTAAPEEEKATLPTEATKTSEFLDDYDIDKDDELGNVQKDAEDMDFIVEKSSGDLISALPEGSTITTLDEDRRDAFLPVVKIGDNKWARAKGSGSRDFEIFSDSQMMDDAKQGIRLPSNPNIDYDAKELADIKASIDSSEKADASWNENMREKAGEAPKAPEAEEAPETPEQTPEAPEEAPEAADEAFSRDIYDAKLRKAFEDEIATKGEDAGWELDGSKATVTDPVKAIETVSKVAVRLGQMADSAKGKAAKTNLHSASREAQSMSRLTREQFPEEAKQARSGYQVSADDRAAEEERQAKDEARETPAPTPAPAPEEAPEAPAPAPEAPAEDPLEAAGVTRTEPVTLPGEKFPPTRQQQDIIDAVLAGKNTAVQAKAGTGKTTTLEALAKRVGLTDPNKKIAYIAFNKTVQTEAEGRMPGNVEARTGHSIAYAWATPEMKKRSNDPSPVRRADDVAAYLGIKNTVRTDGGEPLSPKEQAMAATRTVDTYANSAEDRIEASHLPKNVQGLGPEAQKAVLDAANKIWEDVQKPAGGMKFTLDHMRKLWALSKPDFSKPGSGLKRPAGLIFMDESQDTPPVLAKVMDDQTTQKVVVGDSDQNIYSSFTGSIDYMSQTQKDVELPLTKSWRFGPEVADIGNRFLELVKSKGRVEGGASSEIVENMQDADAILVRSNGGMVEEAIAEIEKGRTVGVPKGTKSDLNSMVNSVAYLMGKGEAPSRMHDDLAAYRNWQEVVDEAEKGDATAKKISGLVARNGIGGLRAVVNEIVENGGDNLTGVVFNDQPHGRMAEGKTFNAKQYLKQAGFKWTAIPGGGLDRKGQPKKAWTAIGTPEERDAMVARAADLSGGTAVDVTIATAHKSKGLEWDNVKIGDDFRGPSVNETTGETEMPSPEELRLAYVATTRAKKKLDPGSLGYVYDFTQENGGVPEAADNNEEVNNDPESDRGTPIPTDMDVENSDDATDEPQPTDEPADVVEQEQEPTGEENDPTDGSEPSDWDNADPNKQPEESPAPEEAPAPEEVPEDNGPVAEEGAPLPEEERVPDPEPEEEVDPESPLPEPAPLPKEAPTPAPAPEEAPAPEQEPEEEAPAPTPTPEPEPAPEEAPAPSPAPETPTPEETPAPAPEDGPSGGQELPTPTEEVNTVKQKAANYPDGTILRSARTGEAIQKTGGAWHVAGKPNEAADPQAMDSPFVYDMPKQDAKTFEAFQGFDSAVPGDIIITRKGNQAAIVGKRGDKLVVRAHNQTAEERKIRPELVAVDPAVVKGINKFEGTTEEAPAPSPTPAPEKKRTPFSGNRGNSNVTITDVGGNVIKIGDEVRTELGTGTVVRVRPSDGPNGSAFVQFADGTMKSFRSNKMRNTAFAEEVTGGDDPAKMDIGAVGEAGDGRQFMVGKGNKPIFKGDRIALSDGREGTVSGFAKGVQSVNLKMDDGTSPRKKASVVDAIDYNAPDTTTSENDTTPEAPEEGESGGGTPTPDEPETPTGGGGAVNQELADRFAGIIADAGTTPDVIRREIDIVADQSLVDAEALKALIDKLEKGNLKSIRAYSEGLAQLVAVKTMVEVALDYGGKKIPRNTVTFFQHLSESLAPEYRNANDEYKASIQKLTTGRKITAMSDEELAAYDGSRRLDFDLVTSKFNPLSEKGLAVGEADNVAHGYLRQGVKVADKQGNYLGTIQSAYSTDLGEVTIRQGNWDPARSPNADYTTVQIADIQPFKGEWDTSKDLKFKDTDRPSTVNRIMTKTYPGVYFDFTAFDDRMAREYAESASRLFNKYPVLQTTMVSMDSRALQGPRLSPSTAVMYQNRNWSETAHNSARISINSKTSKDLRSSTYGGSKTRWFNNVRPGHETDYIVSHEMGHAADFMTGRIKDVDEIGELIQKVWGPAEAETLGYNGVHRDMRLFMAGQLSKYSTENGRIYIVELVAESFADVEHNGVNAKPLSKMVHKEIVERMAEG